MNPVRPLLVIASAAACTLAAVGQTTTSQQSQNQSPTQIVYAVDGSTLYTWDINAQTLQPTQAGTTTLPESTYPGVVTSPDGHFLYYTAYANLNQQGSNLWVYATNASGVPQGSPVQELNFTNLYGPWIDPAGPIAYVLYIGPNNTTTDTTPYEIIRYQRNPGTGQLSNPVTEATYNLTYAVGGETCSLDILGFDPAGGKLYDEIACTAPYGSLSATYNQRTVNPGTGELGADQQIYTWQNSNGGGETVQFVRNLFFDYVIPNNYETGANLVNVYPVQPNATTPLISCSASMQTVCGSFELGLAHPSARYVFLTDTENITHIEAVNPSAKQLQAAPSTIPYEVQAFSPDGSIAYGVNDTSSGALEIEVYGFNVSSAAITEGGTVDVPSDLDSWWAAERY
jgi:hypothetical protein